MAQTRLSLKSSSRPLTKPYKKGSWLIFPNTFPIDGQALPSMNCESNIGGVCTHADSVEDCVQQCADSPRKACHYGFYISKPVKLCMPRMGGSFYPHFDPVFSWAPKNENNPALKGIEMTAFIDSSHLYFEDPNNPDNKVFPDPYNNSIYFDDEVYLKNIETGTKLFTPSELISASASEIPFIQFEKETASPLTVTFPNPYNKELKFLSDLAYYEPFVLTLGGTGFIFRNFERRVGWILRGNIEILSEDRLKIVPAKENESHVHVAYGAPFYIQLGSQGILGLNHENRLVLYKDTIENLHNNRNPVSFTFESLMSAYTCRDEKCVEIPQKELEPGKAISNFKGKDAFRSPTCFGVCKYNLRDLPAWTSEDALLNHGGVGKQMIALLILFAIYFILLWFFRRH